MNYDWDLVNAWGNFYLKTITHDADLTGKKTIRTPLLMGYDKFGLVMATLKDGSEFPLPDGTEDRMWVRAFAAVEGHKEYEVDLQAHRETFHLLDAIKQGIKDIE